MTRRSPYHTHLHSFPTRRSSDLSVPREAVISSTSAASKSRISGEELNARPAARVGTRVQRSEEPRLNSSHLVISYAVFCLKKKKEGPGTPLTHTHGTRKRRHLST